MDNNVVCMSQSQVHASQNPHPLSDRELALYGIMSFSLIYILVQWDLKLRPVFFYFSKRNFSNLFIVIFENYINILIVEPTVSIQNVAWIVFYTARFADRDL